jgi:2-oxoisovalerate dehydrogenase E1 component subunit alpha
MAVTRRALDNARSGQGPTLIEAFTYRMGAHTTTDDPTRYRLQAELEAWKLKDPIERVKAYLVKNQMADKEYFEAIDEEAKRVGTDLRKRCLELPDPEATAIWENVYATEHAPLAGERDQFTSYLGSFEEVTR